MEKALLHSYYSALGIEEVATATAVRAAGRRVSLECHPDKFPHCQQRATAVFQELRKAMEVLQNPKAREDYNLSLRQRREHGWTAEDQRPLSGGDFCNFRVISLEDRYRCDPWEVHAEDEEIRAARWARGIHGCPREGSVAYVILPGMSVRKATFLGPQFHFMSEGARFASIVHVGSSSVAPRMRVGIRVFETEGDAMLVRSAVLLSRGKK